MEKRLFRSRENKVFAGICGGIGEYMNIDPVIVRLLWVLVIFFGGAGILAYIVAIFIIPSRPDCARENHRAQGESYKSDGPGMSDDRNSGGGGPEYSTNNQVARALIIIILIVIGVTVAAKILFGILGFTFFML